MESASEPHKLCQLLRGGMRNDGVSGERGFCFGVLPFYLAFCRVLFTNTVKVPLMYGALCSDRQGSCMINASRSS